MKRRPPRRSDIEHVRILPNRSWDCEHSKFVGVTQEDRERWDGYDERIENLENLSDFDFSSFEDVMGIVSDNYLEWDNIKNLDGYLTIINGRLDSHDDLLENLTNSIESLDERVKPHFVDSASILGDGSQGAPYKVRNWESINNVRLELNELLDHVSKTENGKYILDGTIQAVESIQGELSSLKYTDVNQNVSLADHYERILLLEKGLSRFGESLYSYIGSENISVTSHGEQTFKIDIIDLPSRFKDDIALGVEAYNLLQNLDIDIPYKFVYEEEITVDNVESLNEPNVFYFSY